MTKRLQKNSELYSSMRVAVLSLLSLLLLGQGVWAQTPKSLSIHRHPDAVPRDQCFPINTLPDELQTESRKLLLAALDSEAL